MIKFGNLIFSISTINIIFLSCNNSEKKTSNSDNYCDISTATSNLTNKIVDGCSFDSNAINSFPESKSVVSLITSSGFCTGTFIAEHTILTAAHCFNINKVTENETSLNYEINKTYLSTNINHKISLLNQNDSSNKSNISSIKIHPFFLKNCLNEDGRTQTFNKCNFADIAILKTTKGASEIGASVAKISLDILKDESVIFVGYGKSSDIDDESTKIRIKRWGNSFLYNIDFLHFILFKISLEDNSDVSLGEYYKKVMVNYITPSFMNDPRKSFLFTRGVHNGICQGDSGGPIFVKRENEFVTAGIVHANSGKSENICKNKQSINIKIGAYIDWITQETQANGESLTIK